MTSEQTAASAMPVKQYVPGEPIRILLLTNRDSDNVGDQLIEASAISLIKGAMKNLGIAPDGFTIESRAAGIISKAYLKSGDEKLLASARKSISRSDVVIFGGAPLFNYSYQNFYLRTIRTIELAQEYGVPVLFSSIGVEPYSATNPKSQQLKAALAMPVVRQITTRDDIDSVRKYVEGTDVAVAHVSDPAVFADAVFSDVKGARVPAQADGAKRIGLVVTRAGIFKDNGIKFSESAQRKFWLEVIKDLTARGYDYRLFTTGHFSDEVFLDALVKEKRLPMRKVAVTVNSPEELHTQLSACDGVIAYRLHASIAAFAYGIPAIGLSWNFKVPYFYESVGLGDRALPVEKWKASEVIPALEKAMAEGVHKDEAFLMTVYETLFSGLKGIFAPTSEATAYAFDELREELPRYEGTSVAEYKVKVTRKFRRTYENYQKQALAAQKTAREFEQAPPAVQKSIINAGRFFRRFASNK
ncbi:polysaccharide pyruvyl transferase family protein [Tessaracoccus lacteus]|uniref:Polysaccharide pyruvyl transferase family protein n=1 Tax=Tessaracoccus lacteus TaxID=3041766 RepID=A0ABY8PXH5_9ACTN|nr:polysaccharide pyruvyl transferase family protein [Tessaracoccus sp. T21]WGT46996.1 polysaccharide pyruvyl transferase family protein [Tessaracoccus sp. T21]